MCLTRRLIVNFSAELNSSGTPIVAELSQGADDVIATVARSGDVCVQRDLLTSVIDQASPFLYPCTVAFYFVAIGKSNLHVA